MSIYESYANLLLALHENFHELVLQEYDNFHDFNQKLWENGLNEKLKGKILYLPHTPEKNRGKIIIRPSYKVYESNKYGKFSIEYRSYSGKVAKNIYDKVKKSIHDIQTSKSNEQEKLEKLKELKMCKGNGEFWDARKSIFDFYLDAGTRYRTLYRGDATHYNLFNDLKNYSNYINCLRVWRGDNIFNSLKSEDEKDALITLSWLMFEQDINYGRPSFQQSTHFKKGNNSSHRSRDMIMGFVNMLFSDEELYNNYPFWKKEYGTKISPHFGKGGYKNLDAKYKKYFDEYNNEKKYGDTVSIMNNDGYSAKFKELVSRANQSPYFNDLTI
ncbi:hypothetical protein [Priestia aryabhattai]|uniref:hypothetical protein n=1 Tax=Priestia aryabhattai TaxID=412384 RepID=UPI002E1BC7A3|nr:hypothetical protein [Priestia aryabhattai]